MNALPSILLREGRDRSVALGHPWILTGSVARIEGDPEDGAWVAVRSADGRVLGFGDYDASAQICVRIVAFGAADPEGGSAQGDWLRSRITEALRWRRGHPLLQDTDAVRLVHAEADRLPGLTVDQYGPYLAVKVGTPAMRSRQDALAEILSEIAAGNFAGGDAAGSGPGGSEGAWLRGETGEPLERTLFGNVPDTSVTIQERGRRYAIDLRRGQKTGFYLDQRDARDLFARLAQGRRVLDLYAYTGGFSVAAQGAGAAGVVAVESSKPACELLERNAPGVEIATEDVGRFLRADTRSYDLIALDPPPFAKRKKDVRRAARAYKDVNLRALARAAPGAHMLTWSCSHHVDADLFRKTVIAAARDAERDVQIVGVLSAPVDHPVSTAHPQGEYLKGLLLRVA